MCNAPSRDHPLRFSRLLQRVIVQDTKRTWGMQALVKEKTPEPTTFGHLLSPHVAVELLAPERTTFPTPALQAGPARGRLRKTASEAVRAF